MVYETLINCGLLQILTSTGIQCISSMEGAKIKMCPKYVRMYMTLRTAIFVHFTKLVNILRYSVVLNVYACIAISDNQVARIF